MCGVSLCLYVFLVLFLLVLVLSCSLICPVLFGFVCLIVCLYVCFLKRCCGFGLVVSIRKGLEEGKLSSEYIVWKKTLKRKRPYPWATNEVQVSWNTRDKSFHLSIESYLCVFISLCLWRVEKLFECPELGRMQLWGSRSSRNQYTWVMTDTHPIQSLHVWIHSLFVQ